MKSMLPVNRVIAVTNRSWRVAAAASPRRRSIKASMLRSRTQLRPGADGSASASQLLWGADGSMFGNTRNPCRERRFGYAHGVQRFRFRFERDAKGLRLCRLIRELGGNVIRGLHLGEIRRAGMSRIER